MKTEWSTLYDLVLLIIALLPDKEFLDFASKKIKNLTQLIILLSKKEIWRFFLILMGAYILTLYESVQFGLIVSILSLLALAIFLIFPKKYVRNMGRVSDNLPPKHIAIWWIFLGTNFARLLWGVTSNSIEVKEIYIAITSKGSGLYCSLPECKTVSIWNYI